MRIALVVHDFNRTLGHSRYVSELASRFARGHEVHVFANTFDGDTTGLHLHHVPAWRRSAITSICSFVVSASRRLRGDFDIVHAQGLSVRSAHVITAHICNARWIERRRQLHGGRVSWREEAFCRIVVPLERRPLRSASTTVIAVSESLAEDLASLYGRTARTEIIPHGIDPVQFNPTVSAHRAAIRQQLSIDDTELLFLFVGDLRKGFDQCIDALKTVPGVLVGVSRSDPEPWRARASGVGLDSRVRFVPPTDRIEAFYGAADALAFPTPYDAFGMVITEAMACGLPVITTTAAGAAELIRDGENGILLSGAADRRALAAAMSLLAGSPELRQRLGLAAADTMRAHSWDHVAARTLAVYEQVIAARRTALP